MCLILGYLKVINFPFGRNGKLMVLDVPVLKHIRVVFVISIWYLYHICCGDGCCCWWCGCKLFLFLYLLWQQSFKLCCMYCLFIYNAHIWLLNIMTDEILLLLSSSSPSSSSFFFSFFFFLLLLPSSFSSSLLSICWVCLSKEPYIQCNSYTILCISFGTPKSNKFSICSKWKIDYFYMSQNLGTLQPNSNVLNIGTHKTH